MADKTRYAGMFPAKARIYFSSSEIRLVLNHSKTYASPICVPPRSIYFTVFEIFLLACDSLWACLVTYLSENLLLSLGAFLPHEPQPSHLCEKTSKIESGNVIMVVSAHPA